MKGKVTKNPSKARSLLAAGSYKGYALASMVEILCGIFTGMNFGQSIPAMYKFPMNKPRKLGQFYIVFKPNAAVSLNAFSKKNANSDFSSKESKTQNKKKQGNDAQ